VVGAVEFERALTAPKCVCAVPLGDLEELSGSSPSASFGSVWSVWIAVLTVADGGIAEASRGIGRASSGAEPAAEIPPCRRAAR
jgi:hypothetical protein